MRQIVTLGLDRLPVPKAPASQLATPGLPTGQKGVTIEEFLRGIKKDPLGRTPLTQGELLKSYADWIYTAASTIAERMMDLDYSLVKESRSAGKKVTKPVEQHPFLDLLDSPNKIQTFEELIYTTWIHLLTTGNAYWGMQLDGYKSTPSAIVPLSPADMGLVVNKKTLDVLYVLNSEGTITILPQEQVIHFRLPSTTNMYVGASPVQAFAFANEISLYSQIYQVRYFQNSAVPEYTITYPESVDVPQEKVHEIWRMVRERHQGVEKAHLPMVLGRGGQAKPLGASNADSRYLQASDTTKEKIICGAFKVPLAKTGMVTDFNRSNMVGADITFNKECIKPKATLFCGRLNKDGLNRYYPQPEGKLKFAFANPVPSDRELEILEREHFIRTGLKTRNQILEEMGEAPVENGDEMLIQSGLVPYDVVSLVSLDEPAPPPAPAPEADPAGDEGEGDDEEDPSSDPLEEEDLKTGAKAKPELVATQRVKISASSDPALWQLASRFLKTRGRVPHALRLEIHERHVKALNRHEMPMRQAMRRYFKDLERRLLAALGQEWPKALAALPAGKSAEKRLRLAREKDLLGDDVFDEAAEAEYLLKFGGEHIDDALVASVRANMERVGAGRPSIPSARVDEILRLRKFKFTDNVSRASAEEIRRVLTQGIAEGWSGSQVNSVITDLCQGWETFRSDRISRTEINGANNEGAQFAYDETGLVEKKAWLASVDERTRTFDRGAEFDHEAMNNVEVAVSEMFDVQGDLLDYPGDYNGAPGNIINCRCTTIPVIE